MPGLSLSRRITTGLRWPVGVTLTSWRYLWRITPMTRTDDEAPNETFVPPDIPPEYRLEDTQTPSDGVGVPFHRVYRVHIDRAETTAAQLMDDLRGDLNHFAPSEFASFQKVETDGEPLDAGQEYVVRMPGPWDGPVRVVDVTDTSFRFATLNGHLEAGQIEFRAEDDDPGLVFTIESWTRSASRMTDLLYARLRMSKEVQVHMWVSFLERVVTHSGGTRAGRLEVRTWHGSPT